ncbi:SDR family NAD(P)-dependent oxidoreductase [Actinoplanes sp. NPDC051513]|uniref:SDR family NAD(P)-dependent oxidoreductase n=1 Tax=Actinoplanes sp. NPDC051513 TaxID=3363908 RepID=UPI0037A38788
MDRTIVITGASSGVGLAAAEQLAAKGDEVVVVGRNPERLAAAVQKVERAANGRKPGQFRADFESLDDVRRLADHLLTTYPKIDVLANNAGGMVGEYRRTKDGFEATIQGNHLAPFLLTHLLRERLSGQRVINTASEAHREGPPDPGEFVGDPARYRAYSAYGRSKSANILFAAEAHRRWPDIKSISFHPGVVRTNFGAGRALRLFYRYAPFLVSPEKAGALLTWLATVPDDDLAGGGYYVGHRTKEPKPHAADAALASRLWDASAEAVGR